MITIKKQDRNRIRNVLTDTALLLENSVDYLNKSERNSERTLQEMYHTASIDRRSIKWDIINHRVPHLTVQISEASPPSTSVEGGGNCLVHRRGNSIRLPFPRPQEKLYIWSWTHFKKPTFLVLDYPRPKTFETRSRGGRKTNWARIFDSISFFIFIFRFGAVRTVSIILFKDSFVSTSLYLWRWRSRRSFRSPFNDMNNWLLCLVSIVRGFLKRGFDF